MRLLLLLLRECEEDRGREVDGWVLFVLWLWVVKCLDLL
jgi:hypothetical protein